MMVLGCCDSDISQSALDAYEKLVEGISRVPMAEVKDGSDKLTFKKHTPDDKQPMTVRQVQQALSASGFFPGGAADAICGYIHWGGKGGRFDVKTWSEGCQVINGTLYINHNNVFIDCSGFAARNNAEVAENRSKTRGAYNVLLDLVTALSGDTGSSTVKYMLLTEQHLDLDPKLRQGLDDARAEAGKRMG